MNTVQRTIKNIGMSGLSQLIINLLSFILLIYIARYFGEAEFGVYNFAISFTALFVFFADLGISQLIVREIARDREIVAEYLTNASIIKLLLAFITFGLIVVTINIMNYPSNVVYIVYLFGIYTILTSFAQMFMSIFQAFEKMEYLAVATTIEKVIIIILGVYVLLLGYGLVELAYVYIVSAIINVLITLIIVLIKFTKPSPYFRVSLWKTITIESIPFGLNSLFAILFFKIDTILISILQDDIAVGIYSAAYIPLLALGGLLSSMVGSAIYPVLSKYFISSKNSLKTIILFTSKYMAIIGFPMAVGIFILADRFITLFYAGQFSEALLSFQILSLFIPFRLINAVTGTFLSSINKQSIRTFSFSIATILNIILNILLIPFLSFVGASIATVVSEVILYLILIYFINKYYDKIKFYNYYKNPFLASLIMGLIIIYLKDLNLIMLLSIAIVVYFIVLILLKTFNAEDKYIFKQIFRK